MDVKKKMSYGKVFTTLVNHPLSIWFCFLKLEIFQFFDWIEMAKKSNQNLWIFCGTLKEIRPCTCSRLIFVASNEWRKE